MIKTVYVVYRDGRKDQEFKHFSQAAEYRDRTQRMYLRVHLVIEPESYSE